MANRYESPYNAPAKLSPDEYLEAGVEHAHECLHKIGEMGISLNNSALLARYGNVRQELEGVLARMYVPHVKWGEVRKSKDPDLIPVIPLKAGKKVLLNEGFDMPNPRQRAAMVGGLVVSESIDIETAEEQVQFLLQQSKQTRSMQVGLPRDGVNMAQTEYGVGSAVLNGEEHVWKRAPALLVDRDFNPRYAGPTFLHDAFHIVQAEKEPFYDPTAAARYEFESYGISATASLVGPENLHTIDRQIDAFRVKRNGQGPDPYAVTDALMHDINVAGFDDYVHY